MVRLKLSSILEEFLEDHPSTLVARIKEVLRDGGSLSDELIIQLFAKRIQLADCQQNGWLIDGYPKTYAQAVLFTKSGIIPHNVFSMQFSNLNLLQRAQKQAGTQKFGFNSIILHQSVLSAEKEILSIENF